MKNRPKVIFPKKKQLGRRLWGQEVLLTTKSFNFKNLKN